MTFSSLPRETSADIAVWPDGFPGTTGRLRVGGRVYRCALGRSGLARTKREGDGATPPGLWPVRRIHYRPDRVARPPVTMPVRAITTDDGWCDDPNHPAYNTLVSLPFPASHEVMARADHLYDLVLELGYNDDPPVRGRGSAIFLHLARPGFSPTEGCVAVAPATMRAILRALRPGSQVRIMRTPAG